MFASYGQSLNGSSLKGKKEKSRGKNSRTLIYLLEVWWDIYCLPFHLVLIIAWHISMLQVHNIFKARKHPLHINCGILFLTATFWISVTFILSKQAEKPWAYFSLIFWTKWGLVSKLAYYTIQGYYGTGCNGSLFLFYFNKFLKSLKAFISSHLVFVVS